MTATAAERPVRVVFVDHVARMSGGEIAMLRMLPALKPQVEPHVVLGEEGPLVGALRDAGISVEVLAMDSGLRDTRRGQVGTSIPGLAPMLALLAYIRRLRGLLRELRPDVVHTNSLKAAVYGGIAGRLAGVPVVWHIRDRIADDYLPRPAVRLVHLLARVLPSAVLANSRATLATLPPLRRGQVLYNSAPGATIVPDCAPGRGAEVRPAAAGRGFRVGMVGRIAEWKGQHVFLAAFAREFAGTDAEAWLIGSALFGEDAYEARLRDLVRALDIADQVRWRGFRDDIPAELAELDVLVHASITPEPFGQVVVEGMAAGLPVIAAAEGGPAEIIRDGVDGLLTPAGDVSGLAAALRRVHDDRELARLLGENAVRSVARFTPEATASKLRSVYAQVLGPV